MGGASITIVVAVLGDTGAWSAEITSRTAARSSKIAKTFRVSADTACASITSRTAARGAAQSVTVAANPNASITSRTAARGAAGGSRIAGAPRDLAN